MLKAKIAYNEMWDFQSLMLEDIRTARDYGLNNPTHYALRTILRTSAAYIEGTIFQLRLVCLAASEDSPGIFSVNEILALREKSIFLNKKGEVEEKDSFQKLQPSILFTFSIFAKLHDIEFNPNISDHRWCSLYKFFGFRDSLMHPKKKEDFEITEEKNKISIEAVSWFHDNLKALYRACEEADKKSRNG